MSPPLAGSSVFLIFKNFQAQGNLSRIHRAHTLGLELQSASNPLFSRGPPAKRKEASICPISPEKECRFWIPARSSFLPMHSFCLGIGFGEKKELGLEGSALYIID